MRPPSTSRVWCLAVLLSALCPLAVAATDPALWHELDIVPMPKHIELTGRELLLDGAVLVLGQSASKQDQIGAQWINDQIAELNGKPLSIITAGETAESPLRLIIGTRESNALIAAAAGEINVGPNQPGERGYVMAVRNAGEGAEILLAGADELGALYACVTLGELLVARDGKVFLREAKVTDWPDFVHVLLGASRIGDTSVPELFGPYSAARGMQEPSEEVREQYLSAIHEHCDRLLRRKVTCLWYSFSSEGLRAVSPAARALIKEGIDYGKQRGIGALYYAMKPFAGLVADYPDVGRPCLGEGRYPKWIRCWSLDEMRRKTAEEFARFCADCGLTDIGFHDTDTGGFLNPAQWNDRCETCKQRWGDDYAAATANKYTIFYEALNQHCPDARMHIVIYPYPVIIYTQEGAERYVTEKYGPGPGVPDSARRLREEWATFYRRIGQMLPTDITICIREERPENVAAFRDLIGDRGIFTFFKLLSDQWTAFFSECPRWTGTFYADHRDFLFPPTLEMFVPAQALAVREYAWNVGAPGAAPWHRLPIEEQWKHCEPQGEVYEVILPHVVRNFFGRRVADEITGALSKNVCPFEIFGEKIFGGSPMFLKTYERMKWQAAEASEGAALLDAAWAKRQSPDDVLGMTDYAFRRFIYLRETFHCCKWMATALAENLHARELAREGNMEGAATGLAAGKQAIADARADSDQLIAERPDDPIYNMEGINRWKKMFRIFTPGSMVDYEVALKQLEQTEQELPTLVAAAGISQDILKRLESRRIVHVGRLTGEITLDGRLDEPAWASVYPSESFFVYQEGMKIASAPTCARLLYDDESIYVAFSCWVPDGGMPVAQERERDGPVLEDDSVEIFLAPRDLRGGYVHLMINAAGSLRDQKCTPVTDETGVTSMRRDPDWNAEGVQVKTAQREGRWDAEVRIPLGDLGVEAVGGGWKANLTREYLSANDTRELSSILPTTCRDFHDVGKFRTVSFTGEDFTAPPPEVEMEIAGFTAKTETLNDRIATVCRFSVEVHCSRVLHGAALIAEAYGPEGKLHGRVGVAARQAVFYQWAPDDPFEVGFLNPVDSGGIRLLLRSEETTIERWIRFGGWEGIKEVGAVVDPAGGLTGGGALASECAFASRVVPPGHEDEALVIGSRSGTIEFWVRPSWAGGQVSMGESFEMWRSRHCFFHFGPLRPQYPYNANHSSVTIEHFAAARLHFAVTAGNYAGWSTDLDLDELGGWESGTWHHLAAVWDGEAQREGWLRVYVDGKRASGGVTVSKEERFGDDPSLRVKTSAPYAIQLGSLTSGRAPGRAHIDELRISRTARYHADFEPSREPAPPDEQTTALFHFDGDLTGSGRAPDGTDYTITAVPGVVEYH